MASKKIRVISRSGGPATTEEIIDFMQVKDVDNSTLESPMTLYTKIEVVEPNKVTRKTVMNTRFTVIKPDPNMDLKYYLTTENFLDVLLERQPRISTFISLRLRRSIPLNVVRAAALKTKNKKKSYSSKVEYTVNEVTPQGIVAHSSVLVKTTTFLDLLPSLLDAHADGKSYFLSIYNLYKLPPLTNVAHSMPYHYRRKDGKILNFAFSIVDPMILTKSIHELHEFVLIDDYVSLIDCYMSYCVTNYYREIYKRNFLTGKNVNDIPTMLNYLYENPLVKSALEITTLNAFVVPVFMGSFEMARSLRPDGIISHRDSTIDTIATMPTDYRKWTRYVHKNKWWEFGLNHYFSRTSVAQNFYGFGSHISFGTFALKREWSYLVHYIDDTYVVNNYGGFPPSLPVQYAEVLGLKIFSILINPTYIGSVAFGPIVGMVPDGYAWASTVIAKMILAIGVPPLEYCTFKKPWRKIPLCPLCYTLVIDGKFSQIGHCKTSANVKAMDVILKYLGDLEEVFNYWFQRCLGINDPRWNSLLWLAMRADKRPQFASSPFCMARRFFSAMPTIPTMFSAFSGVKDAVAEVTKMSRDVSGGVNRVVGVVDDIESSNLINRVSNTLDNLDAVLPRAGSSTGLKDYLGAFDLMLTTSIQKFLTNVFPFFEMDMFPKISVCNVLRDYILQKHVSNPVIKTMIFIDMFKNAGVFEVLCEFFQGFKDMEDLCPTKTSFTEVTEAITSMLSGSFDWAKNSVLLIAGFVRVISPKACMAKLFEWIKNSGNIFRGITNISMGVNSIESLCFNVQKCYYMAKAYVADKLGIQCDLPLYVKLRENMADWCSCVTTLCTPAHRNPIVGSEEVWPIVDDLFRTGMLLLQSVRSNAALSQTLNRCLKDLTILRSQISCVRGLCPYVFVPFVVHLNGPVKIGKSAILSGLIKELATLLKLNPKPYVFNESLRFMDGYAAEEIIICDDVNLSKDADLATWLIKLVSPNLCVLPVAENEMRPQISNVKVIVLTSNVAYSNVTGVATHDGIDRRSEYKFEVSSEFYKADEARMVVPDATSWVNAHSFERIPSVRNTKLGPNEEFTGSTADFYAWIMTQAVDYFDREKKRVKDCAGDFRFTAQSEEIKKALIGAMTFGEEKLDLSTIRERVAEIKIRTAGAFIQTMLPEQQAQINLAIERLKVGITMNEFSKIARELQTHEWQSSYPRFSNGVIYFDSDYRDESDAPNYINTTHQYGKPFKAQGFDFDTYFLEHLQANATSWQIVECFKRIPGIKEGQSRPLKVPDYLDYETLIRDSSFMASWKAFFSLTEHERVFVASRFKVAQITKRMLESNRTSWSARISKIIKSIFSADALWVALLGLYMCFVVICIVIGIVRLMTSLLVYDSLTNIMAEPTSNPPRPPVGASNIKSHVTSSSAFSKNYHDVASKVTKNIYACRFYSPSGALYGTFNGTFLCERYLLINWHCLSGKTLEHAAGDQDVWVVRIFIPIHNAFVKYHFKRSSLIRIEGKDAALLYVMNFPTQVSILKNWTRNGLNESDISSPICCHYHDINSLNTSPGHFLGPIKEISYVNPSEIGSYKHQYTCSFPSGLGSSGGLVMIDSNLHPQKIVGIQASVQGYSYAQALNYSELETAMKYIASTMRVSCAVPTCDVPFEEVIDPEHPSQIGTVSKENAVTISNKSSLKKTPWHGKVVETPDRTPVFKSVHRDDLYNYCDKNDKVLLKPFDPTLLHQTVKEYAKYFENVITTRAGIVPTGVLNLQTAVDGSYIGGKSIDLTASPGIGKHNWIKNRIKSGSRDLITLDDTGNYKISDQLTLTVSELLGQLMSGQVTTSTYASFPKDELRPFLKDARGIDGAPIEQKLIYKMLFGRIDGLINSLNDGTLKYGPGINLFSPSGVNLISRMTEHVCMWDFSKYDSSINQQMYEAVVEFYNILSRNDEFSIARHTLAHITCNATIVADNKVYQPLRGMRSGFGGTSSFNTHVHNIFIIMAVKQLLKGYIMTNPTIHDVCDVVDWITYSDDGLLWLKDPQYKDIINGETIAEVFQSYGLTVADPRGKSSLPPPFVPFKDAVFLKQSPYFDSYLNVPLWRCNYDCISSAFSYYSGDDPFEPVDCAFAMLWPYGPVTFTEAVERFNEQSNRFKKSYTATWNDLFESHKALFDHMPYPTDVVHKFSF